MNTVGKHGQLGGVDPLRRLRLHAHRRLGRQHRHPRPRRPRLRHPAPVRAGHRPRPAPPVLRPERGRSSSTSNMPTCSAFPSTSPPSRSSRRRSRRARPSRSRPCGPSATRSKSAFPRVEGYRVELPEERLTAEFNEDSVLELTPDLVGAVRSRKTPASSARRRDLNLEHTRRHATSTLLLRTHVSACSTPNGATPAKTPSSTSSASSSASPSNGSTAISSARAAPIRRSSCTRSWPTWPATASPPASPAHSWASVPSRPCSIPTTRPAPPRTSASTPRRPTAGRPTLAAATSTGSILDSDWEGGVLPRGRVASARPGLRQEPQPRLRSAVPLRLGDAQVPARLHRAGGRRPRRRRPAASDRRDQGLPARGRQGEEIHDGHLLGARREPSQAHMAAGRSPSSPRSIRSRPTSRPRSKANSTR